MTNSPSFHLDHAAALTYITEKVWTIFYKCFLLSQFARPISEMEKAKYT